MKQLKRLTSAMLSLTVLAGLAGNGFTIRADAAAKKPTLLSTVQSQWTTRINQERQKFPDYAYWNHTSGNDSENSYSWTPCNHQGGVKYCNSIYPGQTITDTHAVCHTSYDENQYGSILYLPQCCGFARKLAWDIFGTKKFVRYYINNGKINYFASGERTYEPQVGDQVRLFSYSRNEQGHSIFITRIVGEQIYFAECNGDLKTCQIRWDRDTYVNNYTENKQVAVTKSYLRQKAVFVERPYIAGDFNLNGKIDTQDKTIFNATVAANGNTMTGAILTEYDINGDLKVTAADYSAMNTYVNSSTPNGYIVGSGDNVTYCYRNPVPSNGFLYNNGIYKILNSTSVAFIAPFSYTATSFTVPSSATNSSTGKTYTVTTIGDNFTHGPGASMLAGLKTLTVPASVTTIKRFAFAGGEAALQTITFSGTPKLTTIEEDAFYDCVNLTKLDLTNCNKLTSIGDYAFMYTNKLSLVTFPYTATGSTQSTPTLGTANGLFGYNRSSAVTFYFMNDKSSYRNVVLQDADITKWRSGQIVIIATGKTRVKDKNGTILATKSSAQLEQMTPSN